MLVIRAEIHKIGVRIAIREDTDQTASKAVWLSTRNHYSYKKNIKVISKYEEKFYKLHAVEGQQ